jgi:hypothetical protein
MSPSRRWFAMRGARAAALGLLSALVALTMGDRARSASVANTGIDPLEILNLQIKPNVFIVFDTSGSMRFPLDQQRNLGGDDPFSRLYQAKSALKQVIQANATKVNFGFGTYNIRNVDKQLQFSSTCDNFSCDATGASAGAPILYVANSANGSTWTGIAPNYFPATDVASSVGAAVPLQGAAYTGTSAADIFRSFTAVSRNFTDATCPVATPDCRRYLLSRLLRDNVIYRWDTGKNPITDASALISAGNFACPNPPAGLFPQDPNVDAFPATSDLRRPCFALETRPPGSQQTIFWYSSGLFERASGNTCDGAAQLNEVAPCNQDISTTIVNNYLKPELPVDGSCGEANGFPCDVTTTVGNAVGNVIIGANPSTTAGNTPNTTEGIIAGQSTPLAGSIDYVNNNFGTVYPNQFNGQKNFVLILTDGDDTCVPAGDQDGDGDSDDPDDRAIFAAERAQALYSRTGAELNPTAETLVVAFTADVNKARADKIAQAGSGGQVVTSGPTKGTVTCPAGVPCRLAYAAGNATDLANVLNAAIQVAVNSGEFSDQQSITQSIYELARVVESPAASGNFPFDPMDPANRYASIPVLLQSTFEMPEFKGHLKAFRRAAPLALGGPDTCLASETQVNATTCKLWDAAEKLCQRVTGSANCATPTTWPRRSGTAATFSELHGANLLFNALPSGLEAVACGTPACIKRRIYTTKRLGINSNYTADNLAKANGTAQSTWAEQVTLWPPSTGNGGVAPTGANDDGSLDDALGLNYPLLASNALKFAQLKADFGACVGSNLPAGCSGGVCGGTCLSEFRRAKREAREMILANIAGARFVKDANGNPERVAGEILYQAKPWIMAESTLAAPAVVPPPLELPTTQEPDEYISYRDGPRTAAGVPTNGINYGFGLRNPDNLATANDENLKPVMSVAYHVTNEMLHAIRAAGCPSGVTGCGSETGGEELWGFVPRDQLGKLRELLKPKTRTNHTFMLASPVRFNDIFVRGGGVNETIGGATVAGDGVWRRLALVGRGAGGKFYAGIDITVPGPFTKKALATNPPILVWNRGNFDTSDGLCKTGVVGCTGTVANSYNVTAAQYNLYLKMGETWSVPAMSFVTAANNGGVDFMSYTGSGFTDVVATEGKTFFALATLNGNVAFSHDIANRVPAPATILNHALVASPSGFQETVLRPDFGINLANPASEKTTLVFFPDLHGRIWRFNTDTPATAPTLFTTLADVLGSPIQEQPVGNPLTLAAANSDGTGFKPHIFAETGNDNRIPALFPFRMFAFRDVSGTAQQLFGGSAKDFPLGFRGTVQPTAAFNDPDNDPSTADGQLRVFFAGTRFNPALTSCASSFDSIVFLLLGISGGAAYDLTGDATADESLTITNQRVTAIRVEGGQLVVDMGLGAQNPPPAPAPPSPGVAGTGGLNNVVVGTANIPGLVPFRFGSTVCRE